jgi:hypothetical protein
MSYKNALHAARTIQIASEREENQEHYEKLIQCLWLG